jgi:phage terminase large subunit GpA-like protein
MPKLDRAETKSEFAARVGLTKGRISQLVADGLPVRADGRVDVEVGLAWMERNLDPSRRGKGGTLNAGAGTPSVAEVRRMLLLVQVQAGDTVPSDPLMARREDWGEDLPLGAAVLTAGVDTQGDRIEVQVVGWGRDEEAWVIDYRVLWGDPSGPRLWSDLDHYLRTAFAHPQGVADLPIRAVCVDTGGRHTKMAYEFCRTRLARRVWAIKGRGGPGIPVWPRRPTRTNRGKIPLFVVGVDAVKDAGYARLKLAEPGPGAIHFPRRLDAEYFRQLTAERVVTRFERGRPIRSWQPQRDGERNAALDTFVYPHAALQGLISMGLRLNEEADAALEAVRKGEAPVVKPTSAPVIRSTWME